MTTVAIVGAGISGLTAAWSVRRELPAAQIIVFEGEAQAGGKLRTTDMATGPVEIGAEAWLAVRPEITDLVRRLDLSDHVVEPSQASSALYCNGALHDMPKATLMGIPASSESVAGLVDADTAAKIDAEGDPAKAIPLPWEPGDDMLLGTLIRERLGQQVVDHIASPLIGGVYSALADDLGVRAAVPQLAQELDTMIAEGEPASVTGAVSRIIARRPTLQPGAGRKAVFNTLSCGYRELIDALIDRSDAEVRYGTRVEAIARTSGGFTIESRRIDSEGDQVDRIDVDAVVVAAPADATAKLLTELNADAAEIIGSVDLASSAVVALRYDSDAGLPQHSGILIAADAPVKAKAFTFSSRKWPHLGDRGGAIVRASFGRFKDDWAVHQSDDDLVAMAVADLETITGFAQEPAETLVQRWWGGLPRYGVGHSRLMEIANAELAETEGVAIAGAFMSGVGVPACLNSAYAAADKIVADLRK
ncbi:protoporphyrinogen oxidase [Corynebacterium ulceribovis]|uniref:protoporphyrinogen oxidase n=1 Tax=Corynebacterium ulceribovis TaxID=487732 RepID=UPI0003797A0D|nr:protoporphyrinogen oxidase [Corynebacterium ulceribovis]